MENLVTGFDLSSFYKNKKVFITGHTGFKGSWLAAILHLFGAQVMGFALEPEYPEGLFHLLPFTEIGRSVIGDIRDRDLLKREVCSFNPDIIFHLAAQPLVRRSYRRPAETFDINVGGTANLLEAMNSLPLRCTAIIITTDKVYANLEKDILYKEEDQLGGYDPYSASKACTELAVSAFRSSFFNPSLIQQHQKILITARAGNVIGGGDWSTDRIIPDIIQSLSKGKTIEVRNPNAIRPWQHVLEPIAGYLMLPNKFHNNQEAYTPAYNFGPLPEDHLTVKALVQKALDCWGTGTWKDISLPNQPHEAGILKLDIGKAMHELRWKPLLNSDKAIEWTISWYKQLHEHRLDFTYNQIRDYFSL